MTKAAVLASTTASVNLCWRTTSHRRVGLVSQTNRRRWEIRGVCTARVCVVAYSSSVVVAQRKPGVGDVVDASMSLLGSISDHATSTTATMGIVEKVHVD